MLLSTGSTMGPQLAGLANRILPISGGFLDLNQGSLYPALLRFDQRGWVVSKCGVPGHNPRSEFYELTGAGLLQVKREHESLEQRVALMARFLPGVQ